MVKRKKRLQKGIESLENVIEIHREKKKTAEGEGNLELADYYDREIEARIKDKERREKLLEKQ